MTIAEKYFLNLIGVYCPDTIDEIYEKYGKAYEHSLIPKYIFEDDSYITAYGKEIVTVNGIDENPKLKPFEQWFASFGGL